MKVSDLANKYEVDQDILEKALNKIRNREVIFLTISGKIGAGKDSVAPLVVNRLGFPEAQHISFAKPLRDEVNEVIECIRKADTIEEANDLVLRVLNPVNYEVVVDALYADVKNGAIQSSYERTPSTRKALQWWGTEVRRSVDENYWVKKAMQFSVPMLADGKSIYVTDSRFPNEANSVGDVGGFIVRLLVSEEEQARRIRERDGKEPNQEALNHISETAMDDYNFELAVDTDEQDLEGVTSTVVELIKARL